MTKTLIKIETWLPIFTGFYECGYMPSDTELEGEVEYYADELGMDIKWLNANLWDCIDYGKEQLAVANALVEAIEEKMKEILPSIEAVKMQKVVSPKEYNFENDAINIEIEAGDDFFAEVLEKITHKRKVKRLKPISIGGERFYLKQRVTTLDLFKKYIEDKYTSYDGFASFYSNDSDEWLNDLEHFTPDKYHRHKIGSIIEFLCLEMIDENERVERNLLEGAFSNGLNVSEFIDMDKLKKDYAERETE